MDSYVSGNIGESKDEALRYIAINGPLTKISALDYGIYKSRDYQQYDYLFLAWSNYWNERLKNEKGFTPIDPNIIKAMSFEELTMGYLLQQLLDFSAINYREREIL